MTVSRKKIAQEFRDAKKKLWDGISPYNMDKHHMYICWAIDTPGIRELSTAKSRALDVVQNRLGEHYCIEDYLRSIGVADDDMNSENVQAFRHRWLDSLIEEFSKGR